MSRSIFSRFAVPTFALFVGFALLAVDGRGGDKSKSDAKKIADAKKKDGKKVGQENIVHGCITAVGTSTVTFVHPKFGGTVKVSAATVILVCGEEKTLMELKTAVEAVAPGAAKFCGIAVVDSRAAMNASKIIVCNDSADEK